MKRSLLVAAGTAAGVTAVVSHHAATPSSASGVTASTPSATTAARGADTTRAHSTASRRTTRTSATTRSAVGEAVSFQYGQLQVRVTERAGRITDVSVVSFAVRDQHSESIDQFAVPELEREIISAQSAHVDGVSGASYTSQAYTQSVQSALDKLS